MRNQFLILWLMGIVCTAAVLPYAFTLQHEVISKVSQSLPLIALVSIAQTAVLLAIAIFFGLKLSKSLRLSTLTLSEPKQPRKEMLMSILSLAVPVGAITGVVIKIGDILFAQYVPRLAEAVAQIPIWQTLLAALYGGVVEELLLRLFIVSLFAWILAKLSKSKEPAKNNLIMWSAIMLASVLFGLGHLPVTAQLTALTPIVIVRALLLNGIGGLVFGWLYWKKGLESAIIAHFTADIVLLSVIPAMIR